LSKTCSKLLNETEIEKCKNGINLEKLKELETKSIEKICKLEGFCENEFPIIVNERNQIEHEENVKKYLDIPKVFFNLFQFVAKNFSKKFFEKFLLKNFLPKKFLNFENFARFLLKFLKKCQNMHKFR